ncbi:MAG: anti-sigma factor [Leeuwenhoekiella sp.]
MDIQEYIESGILELYVCGALTQEESIEVSKQLNKHEEIRAEVERIEKCLQHLSRAAAPYTPYETYAAVMRQTRGREVITMKPEKRTSNLARAIMFLSIAASVALLIGLISVLDDKNELEQDIQIVEARKNVLESEIDQSNNKLERTREILAVLRDTSVTRIKLAGQQVAPQAYVNVFWDQENNTAYIDAQGLPEPPEGKVYQVWSLKLNPLTPTSMGLLDDFNENEIKVFALDNPNESQAFGITLEPAGGSEAPTMEQLYTLGIVAS